MSTHAEASEQAASVLRVAAYCRYSSHLQDDGYSIEAQHTAIERESRTAGSWHITYYDEPAQSAFKDAIADRPIFAQLIEDVKAGKYDLVVVHKMDRWARNMRVSIEGVETVLAHHARFMSITEREFDFSSVHGWLQFQILSVFAELYSRNLSQEVHKGKRIRAQQGLHATHAPYGYVVSESGVAVPDRGEDGTGGDWEGLQALFRHFLSGMTAAETTAELNREGYRIRRYRNREPRTFHVRTVATIRANVFYRPFRPGDDRGTIVWQGEEYRGQHAAALTWDEWQAMQESATGRRRGWAKTARLSEIPPTSEFRGVIACAGCGSRLRVMRSLRPEYGAHERYMCRSDETQRDLPTLCPYHHQWARVEHVRAAWVKWLAGNIHFPPDWEQAIRDGVLAAENGTTAALDANADEMVAARERQRWQRKRNAAKALYLEGEIDGQEWEARRREADEALSALAAAARGVEQQVTHLVDAGRLALSFAAYWPVWTTPERMQAAQLLVEPLGLLVRPLGYRGWRGTSRNGRRRIPRDQLPASSCELVEVRIREPFRELLRVISSSSDGAVG